MPTLFALPAAADQRSSEQSFSHPPRLVRAATSSMKVNAPKATYQFTIRVPQNAGKPLQAVTIAHAVRQNLGTVEFKDEIRAFAGEEVANGLEIPLASIGGSQLSNLNEVTVAFDPPVLPGSTVTIALKPQRNPAKTGVYLFGVTAYPVGETSLGHFLGYTRLHFDDSTR